LNRGGGARAATWNIVDPYLHLDAINVLISASE
jgi:hypothetical protein